ncbi:MAG: hypothetical protein AAF789_10665 [Bacteroidota bacterium]
MKKILLLCAITLFMFSCDEDEGPSEECIDSTTGTCEFTTCSNGITTYYLYNGQRYNCDGTDCTAAATELTEDQFEDGCI